MEILFDKDISEVAFIGYRKGEHEPDECSDAQACELKEEFLNTNEADIPIKTKEKVFLPREMYRGDFIGIEFKRFSVELSITPFNTYEKHRGLYDYEATYIKEKFKEFIADINNMYEKAKSLTFDHTSKLGEYNGRKEK
jgi:hypothetical protein